MVQTTLGIAISMSGLLAALNLSKPRLVLADWWMLGWLSATAGTMLSFFVAYQTEGLLAFSASTLANSCLACSSIFLFLYARAMAGTPSEFPEVHFILPVLNLIVMSALAIRSTVSVTHGAVLLHISAMTGLMITLVPPIFLIINAAYCWTAITAINDRATRTRELGSSWADVQDLIWVRRWASGSLIGFLAFGIIYALALGQWIDVSAQVTVIILIQTGLIAFVGFSGLRDTRYFRPAAGRPIAAPRHAGYTRADWHILDSMLRQSRVWTDPHATPDTAARQCGQSRDQLLNIIRQHSDNGFFDLMNRYRIEEAMTLLIDPSRGDMSALQIGLEAGFGSKSAFYAAFQKHVGMTPAAYRKAEMVSQPKPN